LAEELSSADGTAGTTCGGEDGLGVPLRSRLQADAARPGEFLTYTSSLDSLPTLPTLPIATLKSSSLPHQLPCR
jgi:hypothetical protein